MMAIANVFPKFQTVKILVRPLSKNCGLRKRFDSQHEKVSQILAKSPGEQFFHLFSAFWEKFIWNISPVLLGEILGIFLKTLSAGGQYPIEDWENFALPIQMQLSEKGKHFSQFFLWFLESTSNFKYFEEKDDDHSKCVSEITDCEYLD